MPNLIKIARYLIFENYFYPSPVGFKIKRVGLGMMYWMFYIKYVFIKQTLLIYGPTIFYYPISHSYHQYITIILIYESIITRTSTIVEMCKQIVLVFGNCNKQKVEVKSRELTIIHIIEYKYVSAILIMSFEHYNTFFCYQMMYVVYWFLRRHVTIYNFIAICVMFTLKLYHGILEYLQNNKYNAYAFNRVQHKMEKKE